jgi:hypothetical protein
MCMSAPGGGSASKPSFAREEAHAWEQCALPHGVVEGDDGEPFVRLLSRTNDVYRFTTEDGCPTDEWGRPLSK